LNRFRLGLYLFFIGVFFTVINSYDAAASIEVLELAMLVDTPKTKLRYPLPNDEYGSNPDQESPFNFKDPKNIDTEVKYDADTKRYTVYRKIGGQYYRYPLTFTLEEYVKYSMDKSIAAYWKSKFNTESISSGKAKTDKPLLTVESESFDRIFGGNAIDIKPQGSAELTFGVNSSRTDNPAISEKQRKISTFQFDQRIQLNVVGTVGEKLKINTSYNTEATFDFENQMKLDYTGYEDEIIKKIEAGNVSLPINSSLISGSQSLFGIKTQLQFGRLTATTVFSQQKGKKSEVNVTGGAQTQQFDFKADDYEANKHFFLAQYFRDQYDRLLAGVPNVNSPINITRIEVWVTNTNNSTDNTRNFVAFSDLGEDQINFTPGVFITDLLPDNIPQNGQNDIYSKYSNDPDIVGFFNATPKLTGDGFQAAVHFEKIESARKLPESAYSLNRRLGFISLNQQPLNNDEVLAVSFEYTLNGKTYQVGQFSTDGITPPDALILKLLKSTITNPKIPIWDLMMKNVYTINAFQVNQEEFALNVFYNNPETGVDINYLPVAGLDNIPLIRVLNADRLDANQASNPDGVFDFVDNADTEGGTIVAKNGRIFFPVVEPFGSHLEKQMLAKGLPQATIDKIAYKQLYDSTKVAAQQVPELNRFKLKGSYKSASGSEIALNALNIPQGSVVVTAGGVVLQENVDYTVDYNLGRVKIINQGLLESQTPIKIALESNSLFSVQQKTLIANRFDYRVSKDFNLGATLMNSSERPITQKVNYGDDPINNTIVGFDGNYSTDAPFLTRLVDKLPFIETKEPSSIQVSGEFAQLIPGHSKAIGENGNAYVDDFEGSQSTVDLRAYNAWTLASTPQGQNDLFPEGNLNNDLSYGYKRSLLNWFVVDPLFYRNNNLTPDNIDIDIQSNHLMREIIEQEVFPFRQLRQGVPNNISVFNLAYTPKQRGPYNYNPNLEADGTMQSPEDNWAGIMRRVTTTNFESSNVEFIQFWVMDPFNSDSPNQTGGDLYFNLGNISEDILKDSRKSFENGIPKDPANIATQMDTTVWGLVPKKQSIINAFDNTDNSSKAQDVGLDGIPDAAERVFFQNYLTSLNGTLAPAVYSQFQADPSGDNYHYYRGSDYDNQGLDILQRYLKYNGFEGNSPTTSDSPEDYTTSATTLPSTEDINLDNNLSEAESYFQYKVHLEPSQMQIGMNYITDIVEASPDVPNGQTKPVKWYQFKVPIRDPERQVGGIQDFRSIRFFRMFVKNFSQPVVLRFARLELIRGEWRKYLGDLVDNGASPPVTPPNFDVTAVNIEENANRSPVNYVLPPGIQREIDAGTANLRQINEQSLSVKVCSLEDGNANGTYRNVEFDVRQYKKMRMYVHAEPVEGGGPVDKGDVTVFIRLGSDFDQNYYEYEIPISPTQISAASVSDPNLVWPEDNNLEIDFDELKSVKLERNANGFPVINVYQKLIGKARIHVKGNPTLNDIRTIMIGVRNPVMSDNPFSDFDDGRSRCIEIWANELRLTDFDEKGGWAAVGRVNAKLADFANINLAGNISKPGWGSLESRVNERQRETRKGLDATSNFEMGKFLPEKTGIKIPMFLGYSSQVILPQYDPLNPDIELDESLRNLTGQERADRKKIARTLTERRNFNLTNVRKERTNPEKKEKFYDVENVSVSYGYSETKFKDPNIERRKNKIHKGGIAYGFNNKPKAFEPFKNMESLNSPALRLIKDINIYTGIKQFAFNTNINRSYTEQIVRNNLGEGTLDPEPTFTKTFNWTRLYDFKYDFSKNLKFTFNANNQAIIGEPAGRVDKNLSDQYGDYDTFKDSVMKSIGKFGTTTDYNHGLNLTYTWPTKKIPYLEWIDLNTSYAGSYNWQRSPLSQDTLGNTIQNNRTINWNGNMRMTDLYTKIPAFDKVIKKQSKRKMNSLRSNLKKSLDGVGALDKNDSTKTKKKAPKDNFTIGETFISLLMSIKTMNVVYSRGQGMSLPGFGESTNILGFNNQFTAPGFGFLIGDQRGDYPVYAAEQGWLKKEPDLNSQFTKVYTEKLNLRASLEPFKDLQLDVEATRDRSRNNAGFFRYNEDPNILDWQLQNPQVSGAYGVSIISIRSSFVKDDKKDFSNQVFEDLLGYRTQVSSTLGQARGTDFVDTTGYYDGYSGNSQQVLITSFVAAYTGKTPDKIGTSATGIKMAPNWRLSYDGLSKLPAIKKFMRSFTINHAYKSQYSVTYQTNNQAVADPNLRGGANSDFLQAEQISTVTLNEAFSPLINFDITWNNSLITRFELKKDRQISLSLANQQITENKNKEYVIGLGYRFKNVKFPFKVGTKDLKSDLNCRADISIRDNINIIRKINELTNEPTAGRRVISFKLSADYIVNQKISIRAFFDRQITKPALSIPFPTYNTNAGVSVRLTLSQ